MNNLELFYDILLVSHIAAGCIGLVTGYASLLVKRGGLKHRKAGRVYVYAMTLVVITALSMALLVQDLFLFGVGIFSGYFVFSGRSAALNRVGLASIMDWAAVGVLFVSSLASLTTLVLLKIWGIGFPSAFLVIGIVFSFIGLGISITDFRKFRAGPIRGKDRLIKHLVAMCAGLIATTTAVMVTLIVNFPVVPDVVAWLGPSIAIVPVIVYWARQVGNGTFKY